MFLGHMETAGLVTETETATAKRKLSKVQRLACLGKAGAIRKTSTSAMKAFLGLPPLNLVIQGEARSAAHRIWSLGFWSYLHPPAWTYLHIDSASEV